MRKAMKFALLGGLVGAGYAGYKALKQDETIEGVAKRAATVGGEAAAGGLVVGFVLDRRSRRKLRKAAVKTSRLAGMAIAAKHAAEVAKPKVEHAAEVAKPKVELAAKKAKVMATEVAEAAKPKVVDLTDKVSVKMATLRDEVAAASST